jgi:hypothetical protein
MEDEDMSAAALLEQARKAGISFTIANGELGWKADIRSSRRNVASAPQAAIFLNPEKRRLMHAAQIAGRATCVFRNYRETVEIILLSARCQISTVHPRPYSSPLA